jgi:1-acyl-sn-glycerol-3-phosphate acyltransferase
MSSTLKTAPDADADASLASAEGALLQLVQDLASELHAGRAGTARLDSRLEGDLGLDSLARMELLLRVQRRFGVTLAEAEALGAETPRQLLAALSAAQVGHAAMPVAGTSSRSPSAGLTAVLPSETATLVDALIWFARNAPDRVHIELSETDGPTTGITYGQLFDEARGVAAGLLGRDLEHGQSVALMLPTSRDFFVAFMGILLAGGVPVPIYPPFRASQVEEHLRRQALILENARAVMLIGSVVTARAAHWLRGRLVDLRHVATVAELSTRDEAPLIEPQPADVALLQYTSGSTGDPKGVVLTHANLLANIRAMGEAVAIEPNDVVVSWLPLYHDMGLIGAWLGSLYHGCPLVVMPPTRFLTQPVSWLRTLHRHHGTLTAAPNFAYELCASRLAEADLAGLDLGGWRLAMNGSEPVSPGTLERFARRFAPYGFRPEALTPVYGLAESAVALAFTPPGRGPRVERVARAAFESNGLAQPAVDGEMDPLVFVSAGKPVARHEVRVVDGMGREVADRQGGRVQFRGPSATTGYFRNERATKALLDGEWLNTGDLGYVADGEIFITGRSKDVIIRAGRHIFPYEIEEMVGAIPGIRRGGVAVFSCPDETKGTERVVVVAETREQDPARLAALRAAIDAKSATVLGTSAEDVALVPPRTVPKTSSGKTRRAACRELYLRGALGPGRSPRRQMLALVLRLWAPLTRRVLRAGTAIAYAGWFWMLLGLLAVPAWALAFTLPGARLRWRVVSAVARAFFTLVGVRLDLRGREHLTGAARVLVFNHASYLDSIVLMAVLPPGFSIVAKRELETSRVLRRTLRRLDVVFVERFDPQLAAREVGALETHLRSGRSLAIFPEGTNRRIPGLFPFHQGAFLAAARAGVPIVPGGIMGTRTVLRADQWFPRRGPVTVTLRPPITAAAATWEAALSLRDRTRVEVAAASGEPLVS